MSSSNNRTGIVSLSIPFLRTSPFFQFLSLLSAVSCVTESIVPGHVTHSAILNLEGEANSSARKETGQGNAIATFSPLTRQSNGPRLVTLFAKRNEVSKRATFSLPIVYDSNKKSLSGGGDM